MKSVKELYYDHKSHAKERGIPFKLTFDEWIGIWSKSGKWPERGKGRGKYVMARNGDSGPYAVGNVTIILNGENVSEAGKKNKRPVGRPSTGFDPVRSVRLSPEMLLAITEWRLKQYSHPMKTDSEAIRELVKKALPEKIFCRWPGCDKVADSHTHFCEEHPEAVS